MKACTFPGCPWPVRAHGLCDGHRRQRYRGRELTPLQARFDPTRNLVMKQKIDRHKAVRLEAAALAYANAEDDAAFEAARHALLSAAVTLTWSRRKEAPT